MYGDSNNSSTVVIIIKLTCMMGFLASGVWPCLDV